ncbi:MAG: segregation/condensation protein A [Firmicutes bacterium]|nr:segregation/condensation protein A [Bacillota bacterium]MCL2771478.1 segregation/condensation protein A [Bacillota bacterium]
MEDEKQLEFNLDNSINYKLENFEGPLDLLLYLIKQHKMSIMDIRLSEITAQYLKFMEEVENLPLEKASEFIEIAATLLEIKSKTLLPKPEIIKPIEDDLEERLRLRLLEYQAFKERAEDLKDLEEPGRFYKEVKINEKDFKVVLKDFSYDKLLDAFSKMLVRVENIEKLEVKATQHIAMDAFTVVEKIAKIKDGLMKEGKVKFSELFIGQTTRQEVITTFLALLELLKREQVTFSQQEKFGEIIIEKANEGFEEIMLTDDYN